MDISKSVTAKVSATIARKKSAQNNLKIGGVFTLECYDKDGVLKWANIAKNGVVNIALDDQLDTYFNSGSQIATWYIGLINTGAVLAPGDTSASHAGWTEFTNYLAGTRPAWTSGAAASQAVSNAVSVDFNITTPGGDVAGAFLISNSTKSGGIGILYCTALLGAEQTVNNGDQVRITYTIAIASD
jgi:hypothetical protein